MATASPATHTTVTERWLLGVIGVLCGLLIAGGVMVPRLMGARTGPSSMRLGDVSRHTSSRFATVVARRSFPGSSARASTPSATPKRTPRSPTAVAGG